MATVTTSVHRSIRMCQGFAAHDFMLGPVLLFIGIQANGVVTSHILTIVGYKHYRNLLLNHTTPSYKNAIGHLPAHKQGSELFRGLTITIMRYFDDMPPKIRQIVHEYHMQLEKTNNNSKYDNGSVLPFAFEGQHAADLAMHMSQVDNSKVIDDFMIALRARELRWLDADIVVRGGIFVNEEEFTPTVKRLVDIFGERTCLPSAKLQRAPSSYAHSRHKSFIQNADPQVLKREVQELVATEHNYVGRMHRLMDDIVYPMRKAAKELSFSNAFPSETELARLFPPCIDAILRANSEFANQVDQALETKGIEGVAQVCLDHFPGFKNDYQEYLRASPNFTQLFSQFAKKKDDLFYKTVEVVGEQQLKSWMIDPVQRLPRYSLYIDNILNHVEVGSELFNKLNQARDIVADICSLQASDSAERSQTIKRLQGIIPSWPVHLRPKGRLITAVDFYEILPPYNNDTSEPLASILLLFPDCVVMLRRPTSTSLLARGIMTEVDRPASMKISTASKKDGIDLVFAGWCDLQYTRFAEGEDSHTIWMEHIVDLNDNWTKGGEAGYRKLALYNTYEGKASKFTEEVALARLERRCTNQPTGLVGIRCHELHPYISIWSAIWGNEFEGYRQAMWKGKYVIFLGQEPGSLQGSLKAELEDGYEIVIGVEPASNYQVRLEIHALGVEKTLVTEDSKFWEDFEIAIRECFVEMNTMEYEPELRAPCILSTNERLLKSFNISYDGYAASRLTKKLRPPSPVKLLSHVFGGGSGAIAGTGNSSPTKLAKPVLVVDQRTRLPPPGGKRSASGEAQQQKITLVKDETEALEPSGLSMFNRLEKTVEVYITGLRNAVEGYGFNLMQAPDVDQPIPGIPYAKQKTAHEVYSGLARFLRGEWTEKIGTLVGRKVLEVLIDIYKRWGKQDSWAEFQDLFCDILSDMTPQNRRGFHKLMVLCNDLTSQLQENPRCMLMPSFLNLLHLDDNDLEPENSANINFDMEFLRMVYFIATHSDTFFDETHKSHDVIIEYLPAKDTRIRRAQTVTAVGAASQAFKKKLTNLSGTIRGDTNGFKMGSGDSTVNRVASVLKNLSKKDKNRLQVSRSVDEVIGGTETIRPIRPASSDRPLLVTAFQSPSKESTSPPLETIIASPVDDTKGWIGPPSSRPRGKRRSSTGDLKPIESEEVAGLVNRSSVVYDGVPPRPPAPAPPELSKAHGPLRKGSKTGVRSDTPPVRSESPLGNKRDQRQRPLLDRKENISRKPVPLAPAKPSSNQALRPTGSLQLRERVSVERNVYTEHDLTLQSQLALQREMSKVGEELRANTRSRGAGSTADSSVISSASSAYNTSHPTSAASSSYSYAPDDYRKLHTRNSSSEMIPDWKAFEYKAQLHQKEERIRDLDAEIARKDMEVQAMRSVLRKQENDGTQKDERHERREAEYARREMDFSKREEALQAEIRKKDVEIAAKEVESVKRTEEHKAELRKRDKAMKNLNRLYDMINAEQDELYKRCNDELEAIARASAAIGSGALGGSGQGELYKALQESYAKEGVMRKEIIALKREMAKLKAKNEQA